MADDTECLNWCDWLKKMGTKSKWNVQSVIRSAIAVRHLYDANGAKRATISLGAPVAVGHEYWVCPFHISGLGVRGVKKAHGGDSLAALLNAMAGLKYFVREWEGKLKWYAGDDGEIGIPALVTSAYGSAIARELEAILERETRRAIQRALQTPGSNEEREGESVVVSKKSKKK